MATIVGDVTGPQSPCHLPRKYTLSCREDQRLSTERKIISKYCNISKTLRDGFIPLYHGGGMNLHVRPRVKTQNNKTGKENVDLTSYILLSLSHNFLSFVHFIHFVHWKGSTVQLKSSKTVNLLPWNSTGDYTVDQCSETTLILCRPLCLFNGDI